MTSSIETVKACGKEMATGSLIGGALSVATGAAIVCTTPAWIPIIGGATVVSTSSVVLWSAVGSAVGATGGRCWLFFPPSES